VFRKTESNIAGRDMGEKGRRGRGDEAGRGRARVRRSSCLGSRGLIAGTRRSVRHYLHCAPASARRGAANQADLIVSVSCVSVLVSRVSYA